MGVDMTHFAPIAAPFIIAFAVPLALPVMAASAQPVWAGQSVMDQARAGSWHASQLQNISELKHNWDGYNADPIGRDVLDQMRFELADERLSAFGVGHVVPGADGSLQAEWDHHDRSFGLLVEVDGTFVFWLQLPDQPEVARSGLAGRDLMLTLALNLRKI